MISFARATEAEREVLRAALVHYVAGCTKALLEAREEQVRDEAIWHRHVALEVLDQLETR